MARPARPQLSQVARPNLTRQEEYEALLLQHGGYWRHGFVDHAYLYNLHFPPEAFFSHLRAHVRELVLSYPVGQDVLAGLVGRLIDQPSDRIAVGNGAAELIKIVSGHLAHRLIVPVPSFNEYANAASGNVIEFPLDPKTYQLDVERFAAEAIRCQADVAVVVTPNNPTSLLVPKRDLIHLLELLAGQNCMLVVDESFLDFSENGKRETLESEVGRYPNLAVFKSMSKAYGICGLRLGYLLTANMDFCNQVRRGLSIWNVNGFAEEFLRLAPDYSEAFTRSCASVRRDRTALFRGLATIQGLGTLEPEANFLFCRLPDWAPTGPDVARRLFVEDHIFIKHCQGKTMPASERYLRIASRTEPENQRLVKALSRVIGCK